MDVALALLAVLGAFYFILLRPVINQQKKQRQDISSLEVGDEVLTTGGFYAFVVEINTYEDGPMEILLEVAPDVVLRGTTLSIQEISRRADEVDEDELEDEFDDDVEDPDHPGDTDDSEADDARASAEDASERVAGETNVSGNNDRASDARTG